MAKKTTRVLSKQDLGELVQTVLLMEAFCKASREFIAAQVAQGVEIPGASLEETSATRAWDDEGLDPKEFQSSLQSALKKAGLKSGVDEVAPRQTLSPAQLEKRIGKPRFNELFSNFVRWKKTGNRTLSLSANPRGKKSLLTRTRKT